MKIATILSLAVSMSLFLAGCAGHVSTYRFRMHVEVDTPSGVKQGSSVIEVAWWINHFVPGFGDRGDWSIHGDAPYVDLGNGKNLFVVFDTAAAKLSRGFNEMPWRAFFGPNPPENVWAKMETQQGSAEVPDDSIPLLLTFEKLADPKSVTTVRPQDFAYTFGAGYALKRIWIETTRDPITRNIQTILPWFDAFAADERKRVYGMRFGEFVMRVDTFRGYEP